MKKIFIILLLVIVDRLPAQEVEKQAGQSIRKGNEFYRNQQYPQAEAAYNEAIEKDKKNTTAKFNRANALYRQAKPDEAIKALDDLAFKSDKNEMKAKAYYNAGAILSSQKKLEESIEAYKNALRRDPNDKDARENLQKALVELKKKTPPKKDNKQKQQQQKQQKPQPKMSQKEAEQRLKLLEQKEKEVQQRLQKEKSKAGGGQQVDW